MSEVSSPLSPEAAKVAVRTEQIQIEESLREGFLNAHLFQDHHFETTYFHELLALREQFMTEKSGKSMLERYRMALSPKYFDKIHVVELGIEDAPFSNGSVDALIDEYRLLRSHLIREGVIDGEASREESCRSIEVIIPKDNSLNRQRIVIARNRPLVNTMTPDGIASIGIVKRAVYSIPTSLYVWLAEHTGSAELNTPEALTAVESLIDRKNSSVVDPIRVGYYLSTKRVG